MQTQCKVLAKVILNQRLNTLRVIFTFDHNKVTVRNAAYATGDICNVGDNDTAVRIQREVQRAKELLRTSNIVFVQ